MTVEAELTLSHADFALALAAPLRVKLRSRRAPKHLLVREDGTRAWACYAVAKKYRHLTPIAARADPIDRVRSYPVLIPPPVACFVPETAPVESMP